MSARPGSYDDGCRCGQFWRRTLTWKDAAATPVDLTGYQAMMQVRRDVDSAVLIELSSDVEGGITLGGAAGTIERVMTDEQTAELPPCAALYDLLLIPPNGEDTYLLAGAFLIEPRITVKAAA